MRPTGCWPSSILAPGWSRMAAKNRRWLLLVTTSDGRRARVVRGWEKPTTATGARQRLLHASEAEQRLGPVLQRDPSPLPGGSGGSSAAGLVECWRLRSGDDGGHHHRRTLPPAGTAGAGGHGIGVACGPRGARHACSREADRPGGRRKAGGAAQVQTRSARGCVTARPKRRTDLRLRPRRGRPHLPSTAAHPRFPATPTHR